MESPSMTTPAAATSPPPGMPRAHSAELDDFPLDEAVAEATAVEVAEVKAAPVVVADDGEE